jgi:hypothetical protein
MAFDYVSGGSQLTKGVDHSRLNQAIAAALTAGLKEQTCGVSF